MSVKERLKIYIKHIGISIIDFEKSINVSNGYVNSISKSIGNEKLGLIIERYPNLNLDWLLTGKGEMLNDSTAEGINQTIQDVKIANVLIGAKIRIIRDKSNLNKAQFVDMLGIDKSLLSDLESGKMDITTQIIDSLRLNFNVSSDWLLSNRDFDDFINYDKTVTNSYKTSILVEDNIQFLKSYFGELTPSSYTYKMIVFYEDENIARLRVLRDVALDELKQSYNNLYKLVEVLHSFLSGKEHYLLDKFSLLDTFEKYLHGIKNERKEDLQEIKHLINNKLKIILEIIYYKEEREHWDNIISQLIGYLYSDRDLLKIYIKRDINSLK